jgi:hypothetical protein
MKIEDLKKQGLEEHDLGYCGRCHDCDAPITVLISVIESGEVMIEGGAVYKVKQGFADDEIFFKCGGCFKEDKILRNYKKTEVFSRAIGYLRPVNQWNKGKEEEFKMRKLFTNTEGK